MKQRAKISSPGNPFLYPGGRKAAGGVIGGAASQQGTTSGCIAYPGGSSSTFCCFSHRLRRRPPGVNVFTAARKPTPLISSFWDFVFARSTRRSDITCIRSIIILVDSFHGRSWSQEKILRQGMRSKNESSSRKLWISTILPPSTRRMDPENAGRCATRRFWNLGCDGFCSRFTAGFDDFDDVCAVHGGWFSVPTVENDHESRVTKNHHCASPPLLSIF